MHNFKKWTSIHNSTIKTLCFCLRLASPVRSVPGRPLPGHSWLGAGSPGWWMDFWAGCTTPVGVSERWVHSPYIQAQRHPPRQTPARFAGLWDWGCLVLSRQCSSSHIDVYLCCQGDRGRGATAASIHEGDRWKRWEAEERGESTARDVFHAWSCFLTYSLSPCFFQDDLLNELLAEMKALRAVVLAQSQRIELLERQLARIEDGDVWTRTENHYIRRAFLLSP